MPTLHRFADRPGFYVKGVSNGKPVTLALTPEGEVYMTETLGLADGGRFAGDTLKWLYKKKWATPVEVPNSGPTAERAPAPVAAPVPAPAPAAGGNELNPVVSQGVVQIRLEASDHVALDASAEEVVRTLARTGVAVLGPIPLPVRIEPYTVIREAGRKVYELRRYQRLMEVRSPRRRTVDAMNHFALPREVDVRVDMLPG